jgi:hypothetical protein
MAHTRICTTALAGGGVSVSLTGFSQIWLGSQDGTLQNPQFGKIPRADCQAHSTEQAALQHQRNVAALFCPPSSQDEGGIIENPSKPAGFSNLLFTRPPASTGHLFSVSSRSLNRISHVRSMDPDPKALKAGPDKDSYVLTSVNPVVKPIYNTEIEWTVTMGFHLV